MGVQRPLEEIIDTTKPLAIGRIAQDGANYVIVIMFGALLVWVLF